MALSPKLRVWMGIFGLGFLVVGGEAGRDALRPKDAAPRKVTPLEATSLPEGSWVEITGTLDPASMREVQGVFSSTGVFFGQFERQADQRGVVIVTSSQKDPRFLGLRGGGWLARGVKKVRAAGDAGAGEADDPLQPSGETLRLFSEPQTMKGVLYKPGGQPNAKSGEIEIAGERVGLGHYCTDEGIACTSEKMTLVVGEVPQSRVAALFQLVAAAGAGLVLLGLAIFGGRSGAPVAPSPDPREPTFRQVAGEPCAGCRRTIVRHDDGCTCDACGAPTHIPCATKHALECKARGTADPVGPYRAS